jgi:LytS/YehU family sensor histidine kinase
MNNSFEMLGVTPVYINNLDRPEMIKDRIFKMLCIPILGIFIPLLSNLIRYQQMSWQKIVVSNVVFIGIAYFIWQGSVFIVAGVRRMPQVKRKPFFKILMLVWSAATYGFISSLLGSFIWQRIFLSVVDTKPLWLTALICALAVVLLTLVYEVLFLSKERELDIKIVDQLDKERLYAELNSLKGELDPHFVFNSLTTLSHLISVDIDKAQLFTYKLSQVYKYLLINKDRELISLSDEIKFIDDYFFLLRIRYDNKLSLSLDIENFPEKIMILPCSLQLLVENAIKHNQFSEQSPLHITIRSNSDYLVVANNVMSNEYAVESTKIGLSNLSNRYRLLYHKDIVVNKLDGKFAVKIPLIKQSSL